MPDETETFERVEADEPRPARDLLPLVYDELRRLAARELARESPGHSLAPTGLVHEAYIRLAKQGDDHLWDHPGHFYSAAAEAMRRILIERARARRCKKRGGDFIRRDLNQANVALPEVDEDLCALDDALVRLERVQPRLAELVKLRFFAGLTVARAAEVLSVSPRTADSDWAYARAWLLADLSDGDASSTDAPRANG